MTHVQTSATEPDETAVSPEVDRFLRAEAVVAAINLAAADEGLPPIPRDYVFRKRDRESVSAAFHAAFELIGGVPALMQWAQHNPDKFFPLYQRFAQSDTLTPTGNTFVFNSAIPPNPLDLVNVKDGQVVLEADTGELPE
jgi:hypothetical protein